MPLDHKAYCGHWTLDELNRTLEAKRLRLADILCQCREVSHDIELIVAETQARKVGGVACEASRGFV